MFHKQHPVVGSRPGSLRPPEDASPPRIRVIVYGPAGHEEREVDDVDALAETLAPPHVAWIDVQGLGDTELLRRLGELYGIAPLALEDAVNVPVRPKAERFQGHHQIVTRMARLDPGGEVLMEQVTLFVGPRWVLTIQERHGDVFDPVRRRTVDGPRMHRYGSDYLAYALIDTVIDGYYPVVEALGDELESIEQEVLQDPKQSLVPRLYRIRRQLVALRRAIWPQREVVADLLREESPYISEEIRHFLRDCYDHAVQLVEVLESYRDLAGGLMDLYMSAVSNRMNQVMQVLTVTASIFIPLTFIAGIYGMNFEHMPELSSQWGYPLALAAMVSIAAGMLTFFRARGWIGSRARGG